MSGNGSTEITYKVRHRTEYRYSGNVAVCHNQIRMQPVTGGNVTCHQTELTVAPEPASRDEHFDYFGNRVITFSIEALHKSLVVEAESLVQIAPPRIAPQKADSKQSPPPDVSPNWESLLIRSPLEASHPLIDEHRFASPRIVPADHFAEYARGAFTVQRGVVDAALDLTRRIHADFKYDTTATTVQTTTEKAFEIRAGVCQDFAHVQIACLRSIGLPARYVSGYLRTIPPPGKERLVGADESHAWVEVYAGDEIGWVGIDPTNACLVGLDHIPVCIGRDYDDVSPMRGVVLGGGTNTLKVSVDVEPV